MTNPMLAAAVEFDRLEGHYPFYMQPKIDGIRCLIKNGQALSRSLIPLPNRFIQLWAHVNREELEGFDGELMIGDPTDPEAFRRTHSAVMTEAGEPDFHLVYFDMWNRTTTFAEFAPSLEKDWSHIPRVKPIENFLVMDETQINHTFANLVAMGHEGAILRHPSSPYKSGRSTAKQMWLLKMKKFKDAEATIIGFEELTHNANTAQTNELGYTSRSSHKENKVPMNTMGALIVEGSPWKKSFKLGTGFSESLRREIWDNRENLLGAQVKYKYFPTGGFERPRIPVFLGFRNPIDTDQEN